jgi:stage IV sporulation protein FB
MENHLEDEERSKPETGYVPADDTLIFPPKFEKPEQSTNVWIKSILSLALYLILGYYIFPSYTILLLITAIVILHELGHFFAMKYFRYSDLGIFFIPLLGAYVSGSKREVSQRQSAIILLAGPLPGIVLGVILYFFEQQGPGLFFLGIPVYRIAELMIILNLINLFPVYPLDGGQLLNRVFLDEEGVISRIFVYLSIVFLCWFAWKNNFPVLYIFPAMMILRLFGEKKNTVIEKRIEQEGIHTDLSYEELPDQDYWRIRTIIIEEHPAFRDMTPGPPYTYGAREEKIMNMIQGLLHRHLIQDMSLAGKILILFIWIAAIASPWLIKMDMSFFNRFGI